MMKVPTQTFLSKFAFSIGKSLPVFLPITALLFSFNVNAQLIFSEDFESYPTGSAAAGNGDWYTNASCMAEIVDGGVNYGNVLKSIDCSGNQDIRFDYNLQFDTNTFTTVQFSSKLNGIGNGRSLLYLSGAFGFGLHFYGTYLGNGSNNYGDKVEIGTWYEVRLDVDWSFKHSGDKYGKATLFYKKEGTLEWIEDKTLGSLALLNVTDPTAISTIRPSMQLQSNGNLAEMDNIRITNYNLNRAVYLDDIDDYIDFSPYASDLVFDSPATFEFWLNTPVPIDPAISAIREEDYGAVWSVLDGVSDSMSFAIYNGNSTSTLDNEWFWVGKFQPGNSNRSSLGLSGTPATRNEWHHYAVVCDGNAWTYYVDGVKSNSVVEPNSNFGHGDFSGDYGENFPNPLIASIGSSFYGSNQNGFLNSTIDEFRIWNDIRTPEEISDNYKRTLKGDEPNLQLYLQFEELEDLGVGEPGTNDVRDLSGKNRHGDVRGGGLIELSNLGLVNPTTTPPSVDLENGLEAYYSFDDGTAQDNSTNQNHGTINDNPNTVSGIKGNALSFDGENDFIEVSSGLNFNEDFTVTFWSRSESDLGTIIFKGDGCPEGNPNYLGFSYALRQRAKYDGCYEYEDNSSNYLEARTIATGGNFFDNRITSTTESPAVTTGSYSFVVLSYSNSDKQFSLRINDNKLTNNELLHFYEDGAGLNCAPISPTDFSMPHQTTSSMTIGATKSYCENGTLKMIDFFKGDLDELRFYNRVLNQAEVDSLYNFPIPIPCPPRDVWFRTDSDVMDFAAAYPNCDTITGNLTITGPITDFQKLGAIKHVTGSIVIQNIDAENLSGLNLQSVGGSFEISNNPNLTSLTGLDKLTSVGTSLVVVSNPNLSDCSTICALNISGRIGGDLILSRNLTGCNDISEFGSVSVRYQEDFANDPNWTSFHPRASWDEANENYRVDTYDNLNGEYWAHSPEFPTIDGSEDYQLQFELKNERPDWGTYPRLSFKSADPDTIIGSVSFQVSFVDGGSLDQQFQFGGSAFNASFSTVKKYEANKWYRFTVDYRAAEEKGDIRILNLTDNEVFEEFLNIDFNPIDFSWIAMGFYNQPNYGNAWSPIVVDNITLSQISGNCGSLKDLSIVSIDAPDVICPEEGNKIPLSVEVRNRGDEPLSNLEIGFILNDNSPVFETFPITLEPNETTDLTFTILPEMSDFGSQDLVVFANLPNDDIRLNDTLTKIGIEYFPPTYSVYEEDFSDDPNWTSYSPEAMWNSNDGDYRVETFDNTVEKYWASSPKFQTVDASKDFEIEFDLLCENLDYATHPTISFKEKNPEEYAWGNPGRSFAVVFSWNWRDDKKFQFNSAGSPDFFSTNSYEANKWYRFKFKYRASEQKVDIEIFNKTDNVLFENLINKDFNIIDIAYVCLGYYGRAGMNLGDEWSPVRLDNLKVVQTNTDCKYENDLEVVSLIAPNPICASDDNSFSLKTEIANNGTATQNDFEISYILNDEPPVTQMITGANLAEGETQTFTFMTPVELSDFGNQKITTSVNLLDDENRLNDSLTRNEIQYIPPFLTSITPDTSLCVGDSINLTATGGFNYEWSTGESGSTINVSPTTTQTYTVTVTNINGCSMTEGMTIKVSDPGNPPVISINGNADVCLGDSVELTANYTGGLTWSTGETSPTIFVSESGNYTVVWNDASNPICSDIESDPVEIIVHDDGLTTDVPSIICNGDALTLTAENAATAIWSTGETTSTIQVSPTNETDYWVDATTIYGCSISDTITVKVIPSVPPSPIENRIPEGGSVNLNAPVTFSWSPTAGATAFDIFIWKKSDPKPANPTKSNHTEIVFQYSNFDFGESYNWQVIAKNSCFENPSDTLDFTIRELPDLVVENVEVTPVASQGTEVDITWTVRNTGTGSTAGTNWIDGIYLSTDDEFNCPIEVFFTQKDNLRFLHSGQSYTNTITAKLPSTAIGTYLVMVHADNSRCRTNLLETDETNNIAFDTISILPLPRPDLKINPDSLFYQPDAFGGDTIAVTYQVENDGNIATGIATWKDRFFIHDSPSFGGQAIPLRVLDGFLIKNQSFYSGELKEDEFYEKTIFVVLPKTLVGDYYIFVETDYLNNVPEGAFEANNIVSGDFITVNLTATADLEIKINNTPTSGVSGEKVPIEWTVTNLNNALPLSSSWEDRIYLSPTPVFDPVTARNLATVRNPKTLRFNESYSRNYEAEIPDGLTGDFYIFIKTDVGNSVFEYVWEQNNIDSSSTILSIQLADYPDLIVDDISVFEDTLYIGQSFAMSWSIQNQGVGMATPWTDRMYISRNSNYGSSSKNLGSFRQSENLNSGEGITQTLNFTVPSNLTPGQHYLYVRTDLNNENFEYAAAENNNIGSELALGGQGVYVAYVPTTSDVELSSDYAKDTLISGAPYEPIATLTNLGPDATFAKDWTLTAYLSTDDQVSTNDFIIGSKWSRKTLSNGESINFKTPINIPNNLQGNYFLIFKTGASNPENINESNFENNEVALPVFIDFPLPPDLEVTDADIPGTTFGGAPMTVKYSVENRSNAGNVPTYEKWKDAIYLSTNPNLTNDKVLLGVRTQNRALVPGEIYQDSFKITVPRYAIGNYYLIVSSDDASQSNSEFQVYENPLNEPNTLSKLINVQPLTADLTVTKITAPDSLLLGETGEVNYTIENIGTTPTVGNLKDLIYFSEDNVLQGDIDYLFGQREEQLVFEPGDTMSFTVRETMKDVEEGDYQGLVNINSIQGLAETNYENNLELAPNLTTVQVKEVFVDVVEPMTLDRGDFRYYKVVVPADADMIVTLESSTDTIGNNEILVAYDRIPKDFDFDYRETFRQELDNNALVPLTNAGTYYILVKTENRFRNAQNVDLLIELLPFSIISISPDEGGQGVVTTQMIGAGYQPGIQVSLRDNSGVVHATAQMKEYINSMRLKLRWDLTDVPLGVYDVVAENPNGEVVILEEGFTVEKAEGFVFGVEQNSPEFMFNNRRGLSSDNINFEFSYNIQNIGNVDVPVAQGKLIVPSTLELRDYSIDGDNVFLKQDFIDPSILDVNNWDEGYPWRSLSFSARDIEVGQSIFIRYTQGVPKFTPYMDRVTMNAFSEEEFVKILIQNVESSRQSILRERDVYAQNLEMLNMIDNHDIYRDSVFSNYINIGFLKRSDTIGVNLNCRGCYDYSFDPGDSPGRLTVQEATFESGDSYKWEITDPYGNAGESYGWDLLDSKGKIEITATPADPFKIEIHSLSSANQQPDFVTTWSPGYDQCWSFAIAEQGITGFDESKFSIDATSFTDFNNIYSGTFSVKMSSGVADTLFLCFNTRIPTIGETGYAGGPGHIGKPGGQGGPGGIGDANTPAGPGGQGGNGGFGVPTFLLENTPEGTPPYDFENPPLGISPFNFIPAGPGGDGGDGGDNSSSTEPAGDGGDGGSGGDGIDGAPAGNGGDGGDGGSNSNDGSGGGGGDGGSGGGSANAPGPGGSPGSGGGSNGGTPGVSGNDGNSGPTEPDPTTSPMPEGPNETPKCEEGAQEARWVCDNIAGPLGCGAAIAGCGGVAAGAAAVCSPSGPFALGCAVIAGGVCAFGVYGSCNEPINRAFGNDIPATPSLPGSIPCASGGLSLVKKGLPSPGDAMGCLCHVINVLTSCDPNEIIGPTGYGEEDWMSVNDDLKYRINFENDSLATAPAQRVTVRQKIHPNMEGQTIELGKVGFANYEFDLPENTGQFSGLLPVPDSLPYDVRLTAGIDFLNDEFFWILQTIDRQTGGIPANILNGFLPANDNLGTGEGFVEYVVRAKSSAVTGDEITGQAAIIFDANNTIRTNIDTLILDAFPPSSRMNSLPAITGDSTFQVSWTAADDIGGVGVGTYDLYVSENGEPFYLAAGQVDTTFFLFQGKVGSSYGFYTIAYDFVGNKEADKNAAEAETTLDSTPFAEMLTPENGDVFCEGDTVLINWNAANIDFFSLEISDNGGNSFSIVKDSLSANASGFQWIIPSNLSGMDFQLKITDLKGSGVEAVSGIFEISANPTVDLGTDITIPTGSLATLDAGNSGAIYLWSTGESTQTIDVTTTGDYWVRVTNDVGCIGSDTIAVKVTSSTGEITNLEYFELVPNPSNGRFKMNYSLAESGVFSIEIRDVVGRIHQVFSAELLAAGNHWKSVDLSQSPAGVYLVTLKMNGASVTRKMTVVR